MVYIIEQKWAFINAFFLMLVFTYYRYRYRSAVAKVIMLKTHCSHNLVLLILLHITPY